MPYTNEFFATKKVIYTCYFGDVSLDDVAGATSQVMQHLNSSEDLLSVLTNVTDVLNYPQRFIDIWQLAKPIFKHGLGGCGCKKPVFARGAENDCQVWESALSRIRDARRGIRFPRSEDDLGSLELSVISCQ
jgi:hypothetical protein